MVSNRIRLSRRSWLAGVMAAGLAASRTGTAAIRNRPRVAAVVTEFTFRSHAHVILENFLEPYYFNGRLTDPGVELVSLYVDQFPPGDMSRQAAREYGFRIYDTIEGALCCGGERLAVDGVLSIGEHGQYPRNEREQIMYPRKEFFDRIVGVFRRSGRVVPLFNDKHFSYRFDWAAEMMATVRRMNIPFMAGSSVPLAERRPPLELAPGSRIVEAVSIHSGGLESYDFHALEVLQSMVELRAGGESGVRSVQLLEGDEAWKAAREGRWDLKLAEAAMSAGESRPIDNLEQFVEPATGRVHPAHVILIEYQDGLKATVLRIGASSTRWKFACRLEDGRVAATSFYVGPWQNRNLFKALSHAIQWHIRHGEAPYPVERTFLTTGVVIAAVESRFQGRRRLETPHLAIAYQPRDFRAFREMGASWQIITESTPEPKGINPGGPRPPGYRQ
ncbi:MAG: hypothetical protein KatS3mg110_3433 [Pirellulaceae bacterium]|nr:MAG: hypothetical protein KatS3mg110_3433 [Pirellulaceae bacterium]